MFQHRSQEHKHAIPSCSMGASFCQNNGQTNDTFGSEKIPYHKLLAHTVCVYARGPCAHLSFHLNIPPYSICVCLICINISWVRVSYLSCQSTMIYYFVSIYRFSHIHDTTSKTPSMFSCLPSARHCLIYKKSISVLLKHKPKYVVKHITMIVG